MPKFTNVGCSNCGGEFGPGNHGFSHCEHHSYALMAARRIVQARATEREATYLHDAKIVAQALLDAQERLSRKDAALMECSASYLSPPCTAQEATGHLLEELDRRAQLADEALGRPQW